MKRRGTLSFLRGGATSPFFWKREVAPVLEFDMLFLVSLNQPGYGQ
jgi:hypothetical protein